MLRRDGEWGRRETTVSDWGDGRRHICEPGRASAGILTTRSGSAVAAATPAGPDIRGAAAAMAARVRQAKAVSGRLAGM
jgi:hypothetical protein